MRKAQIVCLVSALFCTAPIASAALTGMGVLNIQAIAPANFSGYGGGSVAFVPGGSDSIAQDTLVISWDVKDALDTTKYNHVFQRITIPAAGGTPTVLATATIPYNLVFTGTTQYGNGTAQDLTFDAASKKLVTVGAAGGRFVSFDLFSSDVTISSIGFSKANSDANFGRTIVIAPNGDYQSFYTTGSPTPTNWRMATLSPADMNGAVDVTKTNTALASFTGWYPKPDGAVNATNGFNCEGALAYGDDVLLLRSFRTSAGVQEGHLYMIDELTVDGINAYSDLGNFHPLSGQSSDRMAWGLAADPTNGVAFVRYGFVNQSSAYARIVMVGGLPAVPEPATLVLVLAGLALPLLRRRA